MPPPAATHHGLHAATQVHLVSGREGNDYRAHGFGGGERRQRPLEHRPASERHEGLRAAGSESLSRAGGRNDP